MRMPSVASRYAALFACLAAACIAADTGFAPVVMDDSYGYIDFWALRSSFYPQFIAALGGNLQAVVYAQCIIYVATMAWLLYALHRRFGSHWLSAGFGLAAACNPFMWSYHAAIMSESLTLSAINVLLIALLAMLDKTRVKYFSAVFLAGLAIGAAAGLRPALWGLAPAMALMAAFFWRERGVALPALACFIIALSQMTALEAAGYYARHDERRSSLPLLLYGRAAMLTTEPGFDMPELPPDERNTLEQTAQFMQPIKEWLHDDAVPLSLKHAMWTSLEVFAQHRALSYLEENHRIALSEDERALDAYKNRISLAVIKENPLAYLKWSARYYLRLWTGGAVTYAFTRHADELTSFENDDLNRFVQRYQAAPAAYSKRYGAYFLWMMFIALASFGAACLLLSLWSWARVLIAARAAAPAPCPRCSPSSPSSASSPKAPCY